MNTNTDKKKPNDTKVSVDPKVIDASKKDKKQLLATKKIINK